mmetsp:Transcript_50914/g.121787  ORF Transcript_50914/g.121787 Transcript_50914/m.121787 type:complete len:398 (-) Transcript_50914:1500-2693(-)
MYLSGSIWCSRWCTDNIGRPGPRGLTSCTERLQYAVVVASRNQPFKFRNVGAVLGRCLVVSDLRDIFLELLVLVHIRRRVPTLQVDAVVGDHVGLLFLVVYEANFVVVGLRNDPSCLDKVHSLFGNQLDLWRLRLARRNELLWWHGKCLDRNYIPIWPRSNRVDCSDLEVIVCLRLEIGDLALAPGLLPDLLGLGEILELGEADAVPGNHTASILQWLQPAKHNCADFGFRRFTIQLSDSGWNSRDCSNDPLSHVRHAVRELPLPDVICGSHAQVQLHVRLHVVQGVGVLRDVVNDLVPLEAHVCGPDQSVMQDVRATIVWCVPVKGDRIWLCILLVGQKWSCALVGGGRHRCDHVGLITHLGLADGIDAGELKPVACARLEMQNCEFPHVHEGIRG